MPHLQLLKKFYIYAQNYETSRIKYTGHLPWTNDEIRKMLKHAKISEQLP